MLAVQFFIRDKGIEALTSELGINVSDYGDFWKLSYDQIASPKFNEVVCECRGLILAKEDLRVLCRPFDRFFNYEEDPHHAKFELNHASVGEKIDGSLIMCWWNPFRQAWCASTRNMAYAEGPTPLGNTFLSVVEKAFSKDVHTFMRSASTFEEYTYIFEVVSPETRVVTPYPDYAAYLLAIRSNFWGGYVEEDHVDRCAFELGVNRPKQYHFNSVDALLETFHELRAFDEGYVANWNNWRIKIKNPAYLAIAHLRNNGQLSTKRIAKLVMLGDEEEYLSYFPEDRQFFEPYIQAKIAWLEDIATTFAEHKDKDQKSFALAIKNSKCSPMLFFLKKGLNLADTCNKFFNCDEKYVNLLDKYLPTVL